MFIPSYNQPVTVTKAFSTNDKFMLSVLTQSMM